MLRLKELVLDWDGPFDQPTDVQAKSLADEQAKSLVLLLI